MKFLLAAFIVLSTATQSFGAEFEASIEPVLSGQGEFADWIGGRGEIKLRQKFMEKKDDFGLSLSESSDLRLHLRLDTYFNEEDFFLTARDVGVNFIPIQGLKFFIGSKIVIWGKADQLNPLDVWNAEDYKFFLFDDKEDRKIPRPMIQVEYKKGDIKLDVIAAPWLASSDHRFPSVDSVWCAQDCLGTNGKFIEQNLQGGGLFTELYTPDDSERLSFWEAGARLSFRIKRLDASVMAFTGFDRMPYYQLMPQSPVNVLIQRNQNRIYAFGGDGAFNIEGFGFRGEVKYVSGRIYPISPTSTGFLSDPEGALEVPEIEYVLGVDRLFGKFYANLQFFQIIETDRSNSEDVTFSQLRDLLTLTLQYPQDPEVFSVNLNTALDVYDQTFMVHPYFRWKHRHNWSTKLGLFLFAEEDSVATSFGDYEPVTAYLRSRYQF